ncbi:MAG: hypothetical protein JWR67_3076 [Mucilaginibacter sp.]|nr:hypothetical protein [Mucilaginibacter sp.]
MYRSIFLLLILTIGIMADKVSLLETKVTLKIYSAEILESVIMRLEMETGQHITYSTLMLLPYKAKARDYKDITVKDILNEQLSDTPFKYRMGKNQLEIFNALTGDSSANIISPVKY